MVYSRSPSSARIQNEDNVEMVEMLCIDFRDRLLVVLSSICQGDFTEAKKVVEERLRDLLDTTSSLSSAEIIYDAPNTSLSSCSQNVGEGSASAASNDVRFDQPMMGCSQSNLSFRSLYNSNVSEDNVSTVSMDVGHDDPMLDCSRSTPSVTGGAMPTERQNFDCTDQMTLEDAACVDLFPAETQTTGHISGSCLQDLSFEVVSMSTPPLIDWSSIGQEHENQFPEYSTIFEGEPNFDAWLSNMTWSSTESQSSPNDGHLGGDTLRLNHMHLDTNSQAIESATSVSSSYLNSRSPRSTDGGFSGQTPSSSHSSAFESCNSIQETAPAKCIPKTPKKQVPRRSADALPRDQSLRLQANKTTSQVTEKGNANIDRNDTRNRERIPSPRNSRRIDTETNTIASDLSAESALGRFSNAEEVFETFKHRLSEDRKHLASLLMRLFFAVGSPDSLRQLRDALDLARKNCMIPIYHPANDLATTVSVLDQLDATTTLSHILRRYHLVRLLDHRSKLESDHKAAKLAAKGTKRRLKYDCAMIEIIKRGGEAEYDANARSTKVNQLKYRSKTQAFNDLMRTLYPELQPDLNGSTTADGCEYTRKLTKLKNRLSCARNWYQFEQEFPGAILALIPCAGDLSISIDHVEKLPTDVLRIFLNYLKEQRGAFLQKLSRALSVDLYDILTRRGVAKEYKLERIDESTLKDCLYDDDQLLELCKTV